MDIEHTTSDDAATSMQVDSKKEGSSISQTMEKLSIAEPSSSFKKKPIIVIVVGMAGSGKTTFMHRLVTHTMGSNMRGYVINLDPAVMTLPYPANIDIRDTIRYKEVMKEYNLGPNGGILTSLNMFSTKFDENAVVHDRCSDQGSFDYYKFNVSSCRT